MGKLTKLTYLEFESLKNAQTLATVPTSIKMALQAKEIFLAESSHVIESLEESRWFLIDPTSRFLQVCFIDLKDFTEQHVKVNIRVETPTHSDNINDYPIFRVGIPFSNIHLSLIHI